MARPISHPLSAHAVRPSGSAAAPQGTFKPCPRARLASSAAQIRDSRSAARTRPRSPARDKPTACGRQRGSRSRIPTPWAGGASTARATKNPPNAGWCSQPVAERCRRQVGLRLESILWLATRKGERGGEELALQGVASQAMRSASSGLCGSRENRGEENKRSHARMSHRHSFLQAPQQHRTS